MRASWRNRSHCRNQRPAMDILTVIREFLHDRLGVDPEAITPETTLVELKIDSLMLV